MLIDNELANYENAKVQIKNYLDGIHKVLGRQDFKFGGKTLVTAKIILQSISSIVDYHASFICGKPVTLTGDKEKLALIQSIYKKGFYNRTDYNIAKDLVQYGNAYECVYKDEKGIIRSEVLNASDAFPVYEDGEYNGFVEYYVDPYTGVETERIFTFDSVKEYRNGVLINDYNNVSGLPIHYTSNDMDDTNLFGQSLVSKLMPVMDEIEQLLSKMSDAIYTLSMNPLGVASGQRIDSSISSDMIGSVLNLDDGGTFDWATANLDYNSIKLLLDSLMNQFVQIACVPSTVYGNANFANVSETSLQILYSQTEAFAQRLSFGLLEGMNKRLEYISNMIGIDVTDINISFNYNKPIDTNNLMNNLKLQYDMGAISIESILRNSPYVNDVDRELELINSNLFTEKGNNANEDMLEENNKQNLDDNENRNDS